MPIKLTVSQPAPVSLSYVEAAIKPEVTGHITPTYEEQTVYPAAGTTFGRVEVDPIPDPTAVKEIGSNGDHDVRRYGVARVDVQPTLQSKTATPTEQAQTVTADSGYDGLQSVEVGRIPQEYIVPTGTKNITANGTHDVTDYASASVSVQPNLQTGEATPTEQTQTITPDGQHDGFSSVTVNPIPSQYIVPAGTKQITENGTGIDVSQYEFADVMVQASNMPVLLENIDFSQLNEHVRQISIDPSNYDISQFHVLWFDIDAAFNKHDWMYFSVTGGSTIWTEGVLNAPAVKIKKVMFAKGQEWMSQIYGAKVPRTGDKIGIAPFSLYPYYSDTYFTSGTVKLYGV